MRLDTEGRALRPYEMLKRIEELETENRFLKQWIDNLQKATEEFIKRQPPPAIILKCTPEQLERVRQWAQSAPDGGAAQGAEPGVRDGE